MTTNRKLLKESRIKDIRELLLVQPHLNVDELAESFGVSQATIRRDLNYLNRYGVINRVHGGALRPDTIQPFGFAAFQYKEDQQWEEKKRIGSYAANLVKPGDTVYIGAGTTAYWVAKNVTTIEPLTVATNSLPLAYLLAGVESINLLMIGGYLRRREYTFVSQGAPQILNNLKFDKAIIGISGVHATHGLSSVHPHEYVTDWRVLALTDDVIIVTDHTKIGKVSPYITGEISDADTIITTDLADQDQIEEIRRKGVNVITV